MTFPSRAFGAGQERRYSDYVRSVEELGGEAEGAQGRDPRGRTVRMGKGRGPKAPAPEPAYEAGVVSDACNA